MKQELILFQKFYDFTIWLTNHTGKIPKNYRYSYGNKIEILMIEILSDIHRSNQRSDRFSIILNISKNFDILKIYIRLTKDLKFINLQSYEHASLQLDEIGKILGGYLKKYDRRKGVDLQK